MSDHGSGRPVVLVVDDDEEVIETYELWLTEEYDLRTATDGQEALERLDAEVDVVLLDRLMPGMSGNQVLEAIRDRGIDCRVAMVTAVNPDFDIITLGIDDYLVKPVTRTEMRDTVERLLTIREYNDRVQQLTSKKLKRNVLEVEKPTSRLDESAEFEQLTADIAALETEVEDIADELDADDLDRYV